MDERLAALAQASAAALRGEKIDARAIFDDAKLLLERREGLEISQFWKTLLKAADALNHLGEHALAGEIFESLLQQAREQRDTKVELQAIEGVAESWFKLGARERAVSYLQNGVTRATRLGRKRNVEIFQRMIAQFSEEKLP